MNKFIFFILFISSICVYSGTIDVGILKFAPPFSSSSGNGTYYFGFSVDIMDKVCRILDQQCNYVATEAEKQYQLLDEGSIDLSFVPTPISSVSSDKYLFSLPYLTSNGQFVTLVSSKIDSLSDIQHYKIGVMKDTLYSALLRTKFATMNQVIEFTTTSDMLDALTTHRVDLIVLNQEIAQYVVNNTINNFKTVGKSIPLDQGYGVVALRKNASLIKDFNQALLKMIADGTYLSIYNKYFSK